MRTAAPQQCRLIITVPATAELLPQLTDVIACVHELLPDVKVQVETAEGPVR